MKAKKALDQETPLSELTFCALDLETNGTNPLFHEIIEIAAIKFSLRHGIEDMYHRLVCPAGHISEESTALHGITGEMVSNAPAIGEVGESLFEFIDDSILVIHNAGFDITFLNHGLGGLPVFMSVDTVSISRSAFAFLQNHRLGTVCEHLGLKIDHHRALPDAYGCMLVFNESIKKLDSAGRWRLSELSTCCGPLQGAGLKARDRFIRQKKRRQAAAGARRVMIHYLGSSGEVTERVIDPVEIIRFGSRNYLRAYCHLRHEMRFFRTDRIMGPLEGPLATIFCKG